MNLTVFNLDNHPTKPYAEFVDLQRDFKTYSNIPKLAERIRRVGFKYDFFAWETPAAVVYQGQTYPAGTCFIVDAHSRQRALRLLEADGMNIPPVPFTRVQAASLAEAKEEILFLNSKYGEIEDVSAFLTETLAVMDEDDKALLALLSEEIDVQIDEDGESHAEETDAPEIPDTPITQSGDLWVLGRHRLLCGDSTNSADVARLMKMKSIDICVTSPPYNAGNSLTGAYGVSNQNRTDFKKMYISKSDDMDSHAYKIFLWNILRNIAQISSEETPILWNVSYNKKSRSEYGEIVFSPQNPFSVKETIIWDKGQGMNVAASGILSRTAELIFLMSKGETYITNQLPTEVWWNIWRISNRDGDNMQHGHGASFPLALVHEALNKFSRDRAIVFDPFMGSGTTLIACEQLGRIGMGIEIEPRYCDVIIKRWEEETGERAIKAND